MPSEVTTAPRKLSAAVLIDLLAKGDLSPLSNEERVELYFAVCERHGLDPYTRPFAFIAFQSGVVQMYATKNATDQVRAKHNISLEIVSRSWDNDRGVYVVTCRATFNGRHDEDDGAVTIGPGAKGESVANAMMRATTKSKRRVTLSIAGLGGMLDESELDTVPGVRTFDYDAPPPPPKTNGNGNGGTTREEINAEVPLKSEAASPKSTAPEGNREGNKPATNGNKAPANGNRARWVAFLDNLDKAAGEITSREAWDVFWSRPTVVRAGVGLQGDLLERYQEIQLRHARRIFPAQGEKTNG